MRSQQSPRCHGAGCPWHEHNQRQRQMLPLRINCLLLHQFNELFFRDIWLPCPRVGEKVDSREGRKMLLFSTFCLQIFLLLFLADMAPLFTATCSLPNLLPHSSSLHYITLQSPPKAFPWFSWSLPSSFFLKDLTAAHKNTEQGRVILATISCISTEDQCVSRSGTLFLLNGLWKHFH